MGKISIDHGACPLKNATIIRTYRCADKVLVDRRTGDTAKDLIVRFDGTNSRYGDNIGFADINNINNEYLSIRGYMVPHAHASSSFTDYKHVLVDWIGENFRNAFVKGRMGEYYESARSSSYYGTKHANHPGPTLIESFRNIDIEAEYRIYKDGCVNLIFSFTDSLGHQIYKRINPEAYQNGLSYYRVINRYNAQGMNRPEDQSKYGTISDDLTSKESQKWLKNIFWRYKTTDTDTGEQYLFLDCDTEEEAFNTRFRLITEGNNKNVVPLVSISIDTLNTIKSGINSIYCSYPNYDVEYTHFKESVLKEVASFFCDIDSATGLLATKITKQVHKYSNITSHVEYPLDNLTILNKFAAQLYKVDSLRKKTDKNTNIMSLFTIKNGVYWERIDDQYIGLIVNNSKTYPKSHVIALVYDLKKKTKQLYTKTFENESIITWDNKTATHYIMNQELFCTIPNGVKVFDGINREPIKKVYKNMDGDICAISAYQSSYEENGTGKHYESYEFNKDDMEKMCKEVKESYANCTRVKFFKNGKASDFDEVFDKTIVQWAADNIPSDEGFLCTPHCCFKTFGKDIRENTSFLLQMNILMMSGNKFAEQALKSRLFNLFFYMMKDQIYCPKNFYVSPNTNNENIRLYYDKTKTNLKAMTGMTMDQLRYVDSLIGSLKWGIYNDDKVHNYIIQNKALPLFTKPKKDIKFVDNVFDMLPEDITKDLPLEVNDCLKRLLYSEIEHSPLLPFLYDLQQFFLIDKPWNSIDIKTFKEICETNIIPNYHNDYSCSPVKDVVKDLTVKQKVIYWNSFNFNMKGSHNFMYYYKDYLNMRQVYLGHLSHDPSVNATVLKHLATEAFPEKITAKKIFIHYVPGMLVGDLTCKDYVRWLYYSYSSKKYDESHGYKIIHNRAGSIYSEAKSLPIDTYNKFMEVIYSIFGLLNDNGVMSKKDILNFIHKYENIKDYDDHFAYKLLRNDNYLLTLSVTDKFDKDPETLDNDEFYDLIYKQGLLNTVYDEMNTVFYHAPYSSNYNPEGMKIEEVWDEFGDFQGVYVTLGPVGRVFWLHDQLETLTNNLKEEISESLFAEATKRIKDLEWEDPEMEMKIIAPPSAQSVRNEGAVLSHCVGSYVQPIINGTENILFLRRTKYPEDPFFTVELMPDGNIRQIHCWQNHNPTLEDIQKAYNATGMPVYDTTKMTEKEINTKMDVLKFLKKWAGKMGDKKVHESSIKPHYGAYCAK